MMISFILLLAGLAVFLIIALKLRVRSNLYRQEQTISSPLAEAMASAGRNRWRHLFIVSYVGELFRY